MIKDKRSKIPIKIKLNKRCCFPKVFRFKKDIANTINNYLKNNLNHLPNLGITNASLSN